MPALAAEISGLRCSQRRPGGAALQWAAPAAAARCEVQVLQGGWWQGWEAASFEEGGEPRWIAQGSCWRATVAGLASASTHTIQVRACSDAGCGPWCPISVQTSERPAAPAIVKCVRRLPNSLGLDWTIEDPDGAEVTDCEVQVYGSFCWNSASFGKASSPSRASKSTWSCVIGDLQPNTLYTIQVRGRNAVGEGDWSLSSSFKTSEPPSAPSLLRCAVRKADRLHLEWRADDPEGAEVTACDVQVSGSVSWTSVNFEGAGPKKNKDGWWSAVVASLAGATDYAFRVRGSNAAGDGVWAELRCRTSELPGSPSGFVCTKRTADSLQLEWKVDDPDGAEVLGCHVWVSGSFAWKAATFLPGSEPHRDNPFGGQTWKATVSGLVANSVYDVRVRGQNAVGCGPWQQEPFKTAELPGEPFGIKCARRLANKLVLQWKVADPEGAEVTACEVQLAGSLSWVSAALEVGGEPRRVKGELWEASVVELEGNTAYEVRVRGLNAGGEGLWAQRVFKTSETPSEPKDLKCLQRLPNSLVLQWEVDDPEGAEVLSCEVLFGGSYSWAKAAYAEGREPRRVRGGVWEATVVELQGDTGYDVKARGSNASGAGSWSKAQQLRTSEVPPAPNDLKCSQRLADRLVLEWQVADPEGAEVAACEIHQRGSLSWALPSLLDGLPPKRKPGTDVWQATVVELAGASAYDFRVRGRNESGDGGWGEQQRFQTSSVPSMPSNLKCLQRQSDRLLLQWRVADPEGAKVTSCQVQLGSSLSWAFVKLEPGSTPTRDSGSDCWQFALVGLAGAAEYEIRVRGCNQSGEGAWSEPQAFRTSEVPPRPTCMRCTERWPQELPIEWKVEDPEGAPVEKCQVQLQGSLNWTAATLDAEPIRKQDGMWRARLVNLTGATAYCLRVRGSNSSGDGEWSVLEQVKTSETPSAPLDAHCIKRLPDQLTIEWKVPDPEGAEVGTCDVQLQGSLSWAPAVFPEGSVPQRADGEAWRATLVDLTGATTYDLRIRGCNVCGEGAWSELQLRTSDTPPKPLDFRCVERAPDELMLEWQVPDPEGAEVMSCDVQVSGSLSWAAATLKDEGKPERVEGDLWRATLVGLSGATFYDVRVRGRNSCGEGAWSQGKFKTMDMPAEPSVLRCAQCLPDKLVLEWEVADPEGSKVSHCDVEVNRRAAQLEGDQAVRADGNKWTATVVGLAGATAYDVRVRGCNSAGGGPWLQQQLRTSSLPVAPSDLRCTRQAPRRLALEWSSPSPEGAEITACEVQVCSSLVWEVAKFDPPPARMQGSDVLWKATASDLSHGTSYSVRVRSTNAVGTGAWCEPVQLKTLAGKPDAPFSLQGTPESPGLLRLAWQVADPEDMEVLRCKVQLLINPSIASPYWDSAKFAAGREPQRVEGEAWGATLTGVAPDTAYTISVYASNAAGDGKWLRKEVRTLKPPSAPAAFKCVEQLADRLVLEWEVADPEGAPATGCELQLSGSLFWQAASLGGEGDSTKEGAAVARRQEGTDRWRAAVVGLAASTRYDVRVCARNAVGDGAWTQQQFRTAASKAPAAA